MIPSDGRRLGLARVFIAFFDWLSLLKSKGGLASMGRDTSISVGKGVFGSNFVLAFLENRSSSFKFLLKGSLVL